MPGAEVVVRADVIVYRARAGAVLSGSGRHRVMAIRRRASVVLRHVTVTDGSSGTGSWSGGGIANQGRLTLRDSVVRGNTAKYDGGGIENLGTLIVRGSVVREDTASRGGGIFNEYYATLALHGTRVRANTARQHGGRIWNDRHGTVTLDGTSSVSSNTPDDCHGTPTC